MDSLALRTNQGTGSMNETKIELRTFDECVAEHLSRHPDETSFFLETLFEEYAVDRDEAALLTGLRQAANANGGLSELALKTILSTECLAETQSVNGNSGFTHLQRIVEAFGYSITFRAIQSV